MGRTLVHICCAPDAVYFLMRLREDYPSEELIGFFYDPNIHPYEEYRLRYQEAKRVCNRLGINLIEGEYDVGRWLREVKGLECEPERGKRCSVCFDFRLERSANLAKDLDCERFTTTLLMSPKKRFDQLRESGEKIASLYGIGFLAPNYRKKGGTQEMFKLTKESELYQQDYCGCIYGLFQQKGDQALFDLISLRGRRPGSKEERLFIKEARTFAEVLGLPVWEIEFPFLNWVLLEGGIWVGGKAIPSIVVPFSRSVRGRVRTEVNKVVGDVFYLGKQFIKIIVAEEFKDMPVKELTGLVNPAFVVSKAYKEILISGRIEVSLRAEFMSATSSVLLIGSLESASLLSIPADTLQDGSGIHGAELKVFLEENELSIKKGRLSVLLLGASSLGNPGRKCFEELTGKRVDVEIGYDRKLPHLEV